MKRTGRKEGRVEREREATFGEAGGGAEDFLGVLVERELLYLETAQSCLYETVGRQIEREV